MKHLFTYGTLMCVEIMYAVSGQHFTSLRAHLKGFSRRGVKGESYPAIFPDTEGEVEGELYLNLQHAAWASLDDYEGDMYSRDTVLVTLEDGRRFHAETYVLKSVFLNRLDTNDWDFEHFLKHGKSRYMRELK